MKYERTVQRELPVLLDTEGQLEVTQLYIAACKDRDEYLQTWEQEKAKHKEVMEGHNTIVLGLFRSMDSGVANRPVECDLYLDKDDEKYRLVRIDTNEEVRQGPLAEWLMQDGAEPSDGKKGEVVKMKPELKIYNAPGVDEVPTPLEAFPGEVVEDAPGDSDPGAREFWRGCLDAAIAVIPDSEVVDAKLPKSWTTRADSLYALATDEEKYRLVAYGMGANARSQERPIKRCAFDTGSTDDLPLVQAWRRGWFAVEKALERLNSIDAAGGVGHGH